MSQDVQCFMLCDHFVNDKQYEDYLCPRCYGNNYYFDIHFDQKGGAVLVERSLKLQQDLLKISIDERGKNPFHMFWGNNIKELFMGSKNIDSIRQRIEIEMIKLIEYLRNVQEGNQLRYKNMTNDEIVSSIDSIDVVAFGQSGCALQITVRSKSSEVVSFGYSITR